MYDYYTFLFPIGSSLLAGIVLFVTARAGWQFVTLACLVALALATVVMFQRSAGQEGMEAIGVMLIAALYLLPATLGGIIGALFGGWQSRRRREAKDGNGD
jgi:hypothetical protein